MTNEVEATITSLGRLGDGVAETAQGRIYVAGALPGDRVSARLVGRRGDGLVAETCARLTTGPGRVTPPCPHFDHCGGCAVQHWEDGRYAAWKRELVVSALARRGLDTSVVAPLRRTDPAGRRRVQLGARGTARRISLGFHGRRSEALVDIETCSVMRPNLLALCDPLRKLLRDVLQPRTPAQILLTETREGPDLLITVRDAPGPEAIATCAGFAGRHGVPRMCWRASARAVPEPLVLSDTPHVVFAGAPVALPAGAFLQASEQAEREIVGLVGDALASGVRVADLFSGCGALTFPGAKTGTHVHAVDADGAAVSALQTAASAAGLGGHVTTERRDLFRRPLTPAELRRYDTVIFDPPRAGARAQVKELGNTAVPTVIGVSCNPASFATDAAALTAAGYVMDRVTPIDQFVYSHHVEVVAVFRR